MQLKVSAAIMQVTDSAANMWVTICIIVMLMGVSVAIRQVVFSAVHYAHMTVLIVIMQVTTSAMAMQVTVSSNNLILLSLTDTLFFIKLTRKHLRHYIRFVFHHFL